MSRVVNVSNRVLLPGMHHAAGGLGNSLAQVLRDRQSLWFGWNGFVSPVAAERADGCYYQGIHYATLCLSPTEYSGYYNGFANSVLWPALHGMKTASAADPQHYWTYRLTNRRFARLLQPLLRPDDSIWVHDFHWLPLALELRLLGVSSRIGFFFHTPFDWVCNEPTRNTARAALLQTLRRYDLLAFQTAADRQRWENYVATNHDNCPGPRSIVCPVGVDIDTLQTKAVTTRALRTQPESRWMLGIDRIDPIKGLSERLHGLRCWLDRSAQNRERLRFTQVAAATRSSLPAYQALRDQLRHTAQALNASYGNEHWQPVEWIEHGLPHQKALQWLARADIACITPLRDGMNLVAKEFVAVQNLADPGVLILSDKAGAANELVAALRIDPTNPQQIAAAIAAAIDMRLDERRARMLAMKNALQKHTLADWYQTLVNTLADTPPTQRSSGNDDSAGPRGDSAYPDETLVSQQISVIRSYRG